MIETLLIANRGEIARRVARTCRRLGIRTVAVHTDLDATAPHVRDADAAVLVPSYLDQAAVVAAARAAGADAVHPGYGFLSENAGFARAVLDAGLTWVGPAPDVIERMGRKDAARRLAVEAGVPVVPSYSLDDDPATMTYPVLVKAAAGGGGKGMRVVRSAIEYAEALPAARRESLAAFGDDTLLVETYVEHGRHVEVQVLADTHGRVVHLFERDCSPQRRHQKVLEESPAPTIGPEVRDLVTSAAVDLTRAAGYTNAGTVEFLVDADTGAAYFLEMNTRLQVEHPVTEEVVRVREERIDLVELQLRVAAGEPLGFAQDDVTVEGHAIEARIYAEDAYAGFLPQAGTASFVSWPAAARVDEALASGQVVSTSYDPMLGKVVAHGADREAARRALVEALEQTVVLGLTTNTGFLRELAASREFRDAEIDTAWLDRHELPAPDPGAARLIGAWTQAQRVTGAADGPWRADGFRLGANPAPQVVRLDQDVAVDLRAGTVDGQRVVGLAVGADDGAGPGTRNSATAGVSRIDAVVDGVRHRATVALDAHRVEVVHRGQRYLFGRPDVFADHGLAAGDGTVTAPMPGTVLEVRVTPGQEVAEGEALAAMEAMKMELTLRAPFAGTISAVEATVGQQVALGARLFQVDPWPGAGTEPGSAADDALAQSPA